jgi:hypothetical protein
MTINITITWRLQYLSANMAAYSKLRILEARLQRSEQN